MKNTNRNIRILAEKPMTSGEFNIYLDFSGKKEYLITHRYNPALYTALKDGVSLDAWRRSKSWKPHSGVWNGRSRVRQAESVAQHLNAVIEDYLTYRNEYVLFPAVNENAA